MKYIYNISIAALNETRLLGVSSIYEPVGNYVSFWHGYILGSKWLHGVGIAMKWHYAYVSVYKSVNYRFRFIKLTLQLKEKIVIHIIIVCLPNNENWIK